MIDHPGPPVLLQALRSLQLCVGQRGHGKGALSAGGLLPCELQQDRAGQPGAEVQRLSASQLQHHVDGLQALCVRRPLGELDQIDQRDKEQPLPAYGQEGGPPGAPQRLEEHVGKDQHRPQGKADTLEPESPGPDGDRSPKIV